LVADGKAQPFDGDLEDYSQWLNVQRQKEKQAALSVGVDKSNKNDRAANKAQRQARTAKRRPLLKEVEQIERNMSQWQVDKKACDVRLNESTLYSATDKTELQQLLKTQADLSSKLEAAETRWLELHEQLEAIPAID
ncbi:MAG: ABC transporter ATP-binding protein, partial [Methylotenera sp.]|nr:ABC transporter ATP-binding protein [Methylotenera sp.]